MEERQRKFYFTDGGLGEMRACSSDEEDRGQRKKNTEISLLSSKKVKKTIAGLEGLRNYETFNC